MVPCVRMGGWVDRSHVAFAGEQTLVILRFAIITSQGKLPANMKEVSSPVLRKIVFEEYDFPQILPLFTSPIILLKGLFAECSRRDLLMTSSGASRCLPERWPKVMWWFLSQLLPRARQAGSGVPSATQGGLNSDPPLLDFADQWHVGSSSFFFFLSFFP